MKTKLHIKKAATGLFVLCLILSLMPASLAADDGYIAVGALPVPDFSGQPVRGKAPLAVSFTDLSHRGVGDDYKYTWSFGDGATSNQVGDVTHSYAKEGNYTVSLTISNSYGTQTETKTNYIYVGSGVIADFTANNTAGAAPLSIKFTDASSGNPTKYAWDFGDGTTSSEKSPTHVYSSTGTYTVTLTVSNEFESDTKTEKSLVNVGTAPYVFFTANGTVNSKQVAFTTHGSVSESTTYAWDFGDGKTSSEKDPTHTYSAAGTYNVTLSASNSYGTFSYVLKNVSITDVLKADFTATNNMGSSPLRVSFTDTTVGSGSGSSYLWNFGDGSTSTDRNPTHTYSKTGTYTVALTVTNPCGATNSVLKSGYVSVGTVPVADFAGTPTSGISPLAVQFTDKSQGNSLTYSWDFGDGKTSTEKNPKHTYDKEGSYTVKLTVQNAYGSNTANKMNYIVVGSAPRANFQADVLSGVAPHPVQFTDLSTGVPTEYKWDFGDGGTSTEKNPKHIYQKSGYYNVKLTVTNAYGESTLLRLGDGQEIWAEDEEKPEQPDNASNETNQTPEDGSEEPESAIPGFGILIAIAALLGLVGVSAYSKRKSNK